ncbi:hypothetical protein [Kribbella sp. NPDC055071]
MKHTYAALTTAAFALGALVLTTPAASAMVKDPDGSSSPSASATVWPDEGSGYPGFATTSPEYNYPNYDPAYEVVTNQAPAEQSSSQDDDSEAPRLGAAALGGAGVAFGSLWLYRRRQLPAG